jgi:hypothetical protein
MGYRVSNGEKLMTPQDKLREILHDLSILVKSATRKEREEHINDALTNITKLIEEEIIIERRAQQRAKLHQTEGEEG